MRGPGWLQAQRDRRAAIVAYASLYLEQYQSQPTRVVLAQSFGVDVKTVGADVHWLKHYGRWPQVTR